MRYTEARMAPLALEMLRDIDKDTVPFSLNFDDTLKEPDMLPGTLSEPAGERRFRHRGRVWRRIFRRTISGKPSTRRFW